ncbi:MAG: hypothetical protein E6J77_23315 [Deltaproteobacteria bacterium]|nr:MAG: hypothetical protein E6J77_23315 [Deltaproteobacteria bacterium]
MSRCSGRVAVAALFQTADEMRRVHRLAYRMRQLQESHARFGFESRAVWQEDPIWQPLPEVVERHHPGLDARWHPSVQRAVASFAPLFGEVCVKGAGFSDLAQSIDAFCRDYGASIGLAASSSASA